MNIKSHRKSNLSLESVAMTDIILNMFIFFFISFSLLYTFNKFKESKIKISLPKGVTEVQPQGESPLIVSINSNNEIFIGDDKVSPDSLLKALSSFSQTAKQKGLKVNADKHAAVDNLVKVMDAATQAGINKLGVSIELEKKK